MARHRHTGQLDYFALARLGWEGSMLCLEASTVIWLRMMRLAQGGAQADREAALMVSEKLAANWELGMKLFWSGAGAGSPEAIAHKTLHHYRPRVRANRRRLTR